MPRPVQIVAETARLECPYCGEVFASETGSEFFTACELAHLAEGVRVCNYCEKDVQIVLGRQAQLHIHF